MSDKFIFKILERQNDILLIIENENLKFMTELDENVFKLPYLKNKDLAKFLGKVLDRFSDNILKLNYSVRIIDNTQMILKIIIFDGTNHEYEIPLKSKEIRDVEVTDKKIKDAINELNNSIQNKLIGITKVHADTNTKTNSDFSRNFQFLKNELITRDITTKYRDLKFKSLKIIKSNNKVNKHTEVYEEVDRDKMELISDDIYVKVYEQLKENINFINFIRVRFNISEILEREKMVYYIKKYFVDISMNNLLELLLNIHGSIDILYINLEYSRHLDKNILDVKFLYDETDMKIYKCHSSLFGINLKDSRLVNCVMNTSINNKKDAMDIFVFESLK
jgi:hypothetical protein